MTITEFLALILTMYVAVGIMANYNLIYAAANKKREWHSTSTFNYGYRRTYKNFGWFLYVLAVLWYAGWSIALNNEGMWLTSLGVDIFLLTRVAAWFVLHARGKSLKQRTMMAGLGPSGKLEPLPTEVQ